MERGSVIDAQIELKEQQERIIYTLEEVNNIYFRGGQWKKGYEMKIEKPRTPFIDENENPVYL